jgi:serine/threonine protein kinase
VRVIGEGAMGVVYEAIDRERRQRVALKTLTNFGPDALYRFKNEFRALADVRHRNLVQLYELVVTDDDLVFFTMELVRGNDFRTYVCRSEPREAGGGTSSADMGRLRMALLGLAEGIQTIHLAGKLHRDVKPSNVLVTPEGRVVLLDFGVATELEVPPEEPRAPEMVGTARYMAPEQAVDGALTTASDWYSVGVMLYEVLVGRPPFVGSAFDVLQEKLTVEALAPSSSVSGVPDDLDGLCSALLRIDPQKRPSGTEILSKLREGLGTKTTVSLPSPADTDSVFVGRESHLRQLRDAFETARAGRSITVRVAGALGMGKSTLVQRFLDEVIAQAVVLRGRAYERESIPYKAVDSVVDALTRHLDATVRRRCLAGALAGCLGAGAPVSGASTRFQRRVRRRRTRNGPA